MSQPEAAKEQGGTSGGARSRDACVQQPSDLTPPDWREDSVANVFDDMTRLPELILEESVIHELAIGS